MKVALTIAGSDPSGGAGLQADLKTFQQHGVYGMSVVTLLTVQNTQGVAAVGMVDDALVQQQLEAVLTDIPPQAAKTGALGTAAMIRMIARAAESFRFPLVVDPVMVSKHGHLLLDHAAMSELRDNLLPVATLVTPNRFEVQQLTGIEILDRDSARQAAEALQAMGIRGILLKCGQLQQQAVDLICVNGRCQFLASPALDTRHTHGSGCVLSAAVTAWLALGQPLEPAVKLAKKFVTAAISRAQPIGGGIGPVNLLVEPRR